MSAYGKLDIGFDGPIPVADRIKADDPTGFELDARDAVYDIVLAVTFAAAVGTLAYHLTF